MARIVLAGYLVRFPLGGYAWQTAHYLLGFRALGHETWFYEDTGYHVPAYNPITNEYGPHYEYGLAAVELFFQRIGFGDRWIFVDKGTGVEHSPRGCQAAELLAEADLLVNFGGVNMIGRDARAGRMSIYVDSDPGYTQIQLAEGHAGYREILDACDHAFTFGENIGTPRSPLPTSGYTWHPTRQPVALEMWSGRGLPTTEARYTTVGKWDTAGRDVTFAGAHYTWRKRPSWLACRDLPVRTSAGFEIATNVDGIPGDRALLEAAGWSIADPLQVSTDPFRYRDYICDSRGEFTVAKDLNVRLRSGWFSDRAACYLAAGRPCVEEDTAFGDVLPLGPGLHAFRTVDEAAEAVRQIEADPARASAHAAEIAREYFAADRVLARMLAVAGC